MSGLDEVEEWLRERSFLLQMLTDATNALLASYLAKPDQAILEENPALQNLIERYIAILDYKRKSTVPGVWTILQMAKIPPKLVRPTKDLEFARNAIAFLLNTHVPLSLATASVAAAGFSGVAQQSAIARTLQKVRHFAHSGERRRLCSLPRVDERGASLGGNGRRRSVLHFLRNAADQRFRPGVPAAAFGWVRTFKTRGGGHSAGGNGGEPEHFWIFGSAAGAGGFDCARPLQIVRL